MQLRVCTSVVLHSEFAFARTETIQHTRDQDGMHRKTQKTYRQEINHRKRHSYVISITYVVHSSLYNQIHLLFIHCTCQSTPSRTQLFGYPHDNHCSLHPSIPPHHLTLSLLHQTIRLSPHSHPVLSPLTRLFG